MEPAAPSFFVRHEFLIRRLHSLSGLIPVGAYMVVHLVVNASVLDSPLTYQKNVYMIHGLGAILPVVEWGFIFLPILFHAIIGVVIVAGGLPNQRDYPYAANWRYTLQRWTGMIAFAFIVWHVFHMHGWFHSEAWLQSVAKPLGGAQFHPFNAGSSASIALQGVVYPLLYAVGILASVFHLANGIWTMGITWGVWTSPHAQQWAARVCGVFGVLLAIVGLGAVWGFNSVGHDDQAVQELRQQEDRMYEHHVEAGLVKPDEHKRTAPDEPADNNMAHTDREMAD